LGASHGHLFVVDAEAEHSLSQIFLEAVAAVTGEETPVIHLPCLPGSTHLDISGAIAVQVIRSLTQNNQGQRYLNVEQIQNENIKFRSGWWWGWWVGMTEEQLVVGVVAAHNLMPKDGQGSSSSFVEVEFEHQQ
ncbi:hypothetical protein Taro_046684, partial [Colocasia esculenta]|nr:hypothetical protein [Colocasia esculenta]